MKLVKLNRRYKAFKEYGHQWAFRWESYDTKDCAKVERIMQDMHGSQYRWDKNASRAWQASFGHPTRGNSYRPYWVSFTDEHDATVILLKLQD